jgi:hypothetical protein
MLITKHGLFYRYDVTSTSFLDIYRGAVAVVPKRQPGNKNNGHEVNKAVSI